MTTTLINDHQKSSTTNMFDISPKCPAIADKITGIFGWRHTYRVHHRHKNLKHFHSLHKTYSLNLPRKDTDSNVVVHHLHSQSGILDPDDRVNDVADDRERIVATFDDSHGPEPPVPQGGGDGASGSSVGTGSPDIFRGAPETKYTPDNIPHIEVTGANEAPPGLGLQVRRGSEPSLHQIGISDQAYISPIHNNTDHTKRWSAAPVCRSDNEPPEKILSNGGTNGFQPWCLEESELEESHNENQNNFSRSGRLSMQFLGDGGGYRWMDAADRVNQNVPAHLPPQPVIYNSKSLPRELKRKEPLGQAYESIREKNEEMLLIINEPKGPLGLTAIPDSENGGLLVQFVEPSSRAERGRLRRGDRILEINGTKLIGLSDVAVQNHLRKSLSDPELRLRVIRGSRDRRGSKIVELIEAGEKITSNNVATVSPTRKTHGPPAGTSLQVANTRRLGRRIEIALKKGPLGLGFSVTTRDNPAGGDCPIYIKNILPRGAAIEDGRLKPGDRLLDVDGIAMTGKTQTEVVAILRATQPGATVNIIVSRQQELSELDEREIGTSAVATVDLPESAAPPKPPPPVLPQKPQKNKQHLNDSVSSTISIKHTTTHENETTNGNYNESFAANVSYNNNNNNYNHDGGLHHDPYPKSAAHSRAKSSIPQESNSVFPWRNREVLTLHIPVHDTEKAGLGVSVKGKTGSNSMGNLNNSKFDGDLGIFIKTVIHGGAASRDGRLKMNDQLLNVNGISLLGQSNSEAMETLRRAMLKTGGNYPGMISLKIARRMPRLNSSNEQIDTDTSNTSDKSGTTVIYLHSENSRERDSSIDCKSSAMGSNGRNNSMNETSNKRFSNPILDRLTGGNSSNYSNRPPPLITHGLRNESYYMATTDNWSPGSTLNGNVNNSVLIEEDPEPPSPSLPYHSTPAIPPKPVLTPTTDITYSSQLSLDTNPPVDAFSRDAIGRRSISEKHHAALDAKETGTYQRNKKLREERERRAMANPGAGSVESLARRPKQNANANHDLYAEALDNVGELGPSLGLKKSSSLESLQTMVQEIQMSDEPRGPMALRTPRGRGREESLRAAVERPSENQPRKHWLLEEGPSDSEGGFINPRNGPFQSSLNDRKHKMRQKKPSILKGIGHMFRFGKHRKDGIAPTETLSEFGVTTTGTNNIMTTSTDSIKFQTLPQLPSSQAPTSSSQYNDRKVGGPPMYQPPPPVGSAAAVAAAAAAAANNGIHKNDLFNHRYSHYVNYEELQQQISLSSSASSEHLSESTLDQMRRQVMHQRTKVEEESRRHQHYHSQRSTRTEGSHNGQRPVSSYYEYETVQAGSGNNSGSGVQRKVSIPNSSSSQWNSTSGRNRGPFITQVTIRDQNIGGSQPASQV